MIHNTNEFSANGIRLVSLEITTPPAKTTYKPGHRFNPAGMTVSAVYSNGAAKTVEGYAIEPEILTADTAAVTIRYTDGILSQIVEQAVIVEPATIYGATWDGTSTTKLTRTDAAAGFADPIPYVAESSDYGSPFDELWPWAGMARATDEEAGELVKIPKFWYKLTQDGDEISIQIADGAVDGFSVCPFCMDRGDGKGERDNAYIGRYHCAANTFKSTTGVKPETSEATQTKWIRAPDFRKNIHDLGNEIYMMDFAALFTIWLLYIVEFADWDSSKCIGWGCGDNLSGGVQPVGYTDSMPYHTGTMLSSRTTFGPSIQYRNIEGLWENCYDLLSGVYYTSDGLIVSVNPEIPAEDNGGVSVGTPENGWVVALSVSNSGLFPCFISRHRDVDDWDMYTAPTIYISDRWQFHENSFVCFGGYYYGSPYSGSGIFEIQFVYTNESAPYAGSRLMKLP